MPRKLQKAPPVEQCQHVSATMGTFECGDGFIYYAKCEKCRKPFRAKPKEDQAVDAFEVEAIETLLPNAKVFTTTK